MMKLNKAMVFACNAHKGQLDDNGDSYYDSHLVPVIRIMEEVTKDIDILCAAILHDTIEDTYVTYEELKAEFGKRVADLVNEVSHDGQKDEYGFYFPRLKSKDAVLIKFADRLSNLSRMQSWDQKRQDHYVKRSKFWKTGEDKE